MFPGITLPSDYARLALKVAPWVFLAIFFAMWWHRGDVIERKDAERAALVSEIARKTEQARAEDMAHARAVEAAQSQVREEVSRDLETKLAAARAAADDYARRLRDKAAQGGGGKPRLPGTPAATVNPVGAGEAADVDDARACADAVIKAEGWQDWFTSIRTIERDHE